jgi:AraC-like DNA-binding protein
VSSSAVTVIRHDTEFGKWESATRAAHPALRPDVSGYEGYREELSFTRRLQLPSTEVPVILGFGAPLTTIYAGEAPGTSAVARAFIAGVHDRWVICESSGVSAGIQVNFKPVGASRFLGMPVGELVNRCVDVRDCLGPEGVRLVQHLEDLPDWESRFAVLEAFILRRLALERGMPREVARALQQLECSGGRMAIHALADDIGWSQKHLIGQFRTYIGLAPKTVARVIRFDRAVQRLQQPGAPRIADIAQECGYYDQAHFARDFREFTGGTARELLQRVLPHGAGLIAD